MGPKRAENFTHEQRMGLIQLIRLQVKVIEDKRSDTSSNRKKQKAWDEIEKQMAANFPERARASAKDLKELWRRMKGKTKTVARDKKIDMAKTGGGAPEVDDLDEETVAILSIIAKDLEQIKNTYDDDCTGAVTDTRDEDVTAGTSSSGNTNKRQVCLLMIIMKNTHF
ncbi:fibrinogen silencer-binding protein-like [Lineus longissimus]|uniref:fibrinogen silencer-binding protein-like n=1 Tax=Lineus longissimus TaxID=88925 RepID=UPI00315D95EA